MYFTGFFQLTNMVTILKALIYSYNERIQSDFERLKLSFLRSKKKHLVIAIFLIITFLNKFFSFMNRKTLEIVAVDSKNEGYLQYNKANLKTCIKLQSIKNHYKLCRSRGKCL